MKLSSHVLIWTLFPLMLVIGLILLQVYHLQHQVEETIETRMVQDRGHITQKLLDELKQTHSIAKLLGSAVEIAQALQNNDADVPYLWGKQFLDFHTDRIYFLDQEGIVLSRGHDEFRFGDDFSDNVYIRYALENNRFTGIFPGLDREEPTIMSIEPVILYDEFLVGVIVVEKEITPALLKRLSNREGMFITMQNQFDEVGTSLPDSLQTEMLDRYAFSLDDEAVSSHYALSLEIFEDNRDEKQNYESLFLRIMLITSAVLPVGILTIIYFVRRLLRPAESMVQYLNDYSNQAISLQSLREKIDTVPTRKNELARINSALSEMLQNLQSTQNQLIESEKMSSLGGLVAGVAHELNTPLGICVTGLSSLDTQMREMQEKFLEGKIKKSELEKFFRNGVEYCRLLEHNIKRSSQLVQSFKEVSVDQATEERRQFDLVYYLDEILLSLKPKLKRTPHEIRVDYPERLMLTSYPGVFSQLLTNLVFNSLLHGFDGIEKGIITLTLKKEKQFARITYTDNGKGMKEETLKQIFEPFYTTKRGKGGTGLGMHIVYNLVTQKLQGQIECQSSPGEGVCFTIVVPLHQTREG